jgi:hypothetical protein
MTVPDYSIRLAPPADDTDALARIEAKLDALADAVAPLLAMLEEYAPLLEQARQRLGKPRFRR